MALIECPDCEKEISDQATSCIHCGRPMETPPPQTTESHVTHSAAVEAGNQASKTRYDSGGAVGLAGILIAAIIGFMTGSWTVFFIAALAGMGIGVMIQFSRPKVAASSSTKPENDGWG